jgi:hypothetical protein
MLRRSLRAFDSRGLRRIGEARRQEPGRPTASIVGYGRTQAACRPAQGMFKAAMRDTRRFTCKSRPRVNPVRLGPEDMRGASDWA